MFVPQREFFQLFSFTVLLFSLSPFLFQRISNPNLNLFSIFAFSDLLKQFVISQWCFHVKSYEFSTTKAQKVPLVNGT
jgi:hypothetical protein